MPPADSCRDFGLSRRDLLRAGGLGVFGLGLTDLLAAAPARPHAKACVLVFAWGGPSQLDTWDPKPDAPPEVRGEFKAVPTSVPGLLVGEHFPRLARLAHAYAVVRTVTHTDPAHLSSVHHVLTGRLAPKPNSDADPPSRRDTPHVGAMVARLAPPAGPLPPFVTVPWLVSHPAAPGGTAPGQNAGWLGTAHDPYVVPGDPNAPGFRAGPQASPEVSVARLGGRRDLLRHLDRGAGDGLSALQAKAFDLLGSAAARRAFDLSEEPPRVRDRYGRHTHGQCLLLARRLVEAGVRLVQVNWHNDGQFYWDTHGNNFTSLKDRLMPPTDEGFSALLEDLAQRGLLDETLVVWVGEFGRRPQITPGGGREHWPHCYPAVFAGGGVRGGAVYGKSDRHAAHPIDNPVSPADLTATVYQALGVAPDTTVPDREGRPVALTEGVPLTTLFG